MRVIVCGSRDWPDMMVVRDELTKLQVRMGKPLLIVHGDCPTGADRYASQWARAVGGGEEPHYADWDAYGRAAGPMRNKEMAMLGAVLCLAFWDGKSRGTNNMLKCAREAGIPIRVIAPRSLNAP